MRVINTRISSKDKVCSKRLTYQKLQKELRVSDLFLKTKGSGPSTNYCDPSAVPAWLMPKCL